MLQVRGDADFLNESRDAEDGGELGVKNLYCDPATVFLVKSEIYGRHTTAADLLLHAISGEGLLDLLDIFRHPSASPPLRGACRKTVALSWVAGLVWSTTNLSGTVTHSNKKSLIGQEAVFRIVDNANRTDFASIINFHVVGTSTDCTAGEFDVAPVKGNFTVQP